MKNRYASIDLLRAFCAFLVVLIHTQSQEGVEFKQWFLKIFPSPNALFALIAGWFMYKAVALSVDHTGIRRFESVTHEFKTYIKGRVQKLVVPYLFWTIVYVALNLIFNYLTQTASSLKISNWAEIIFSGGGTVHLWFLITLFYAQSLLYVLFLIEKNKPKSVWIIINFILAIIMIYTYRRFPQATLVRELFFMIGYVLLGSIAYQIKEYLDHYRKSIMILGGIIMTTRLIFLYSFGTALYAEWIYPGLVLVFAYLLRHQAIPVFLQSFGLHSMGIYIVHILVATGVCILLKAMQIELPAFLLALIIFVGSYCLSMVMKKLRFRTFTFF